VDKNITLLEGKVAELKEVEKERGSRGGYSEEKKRCG